MSRPGVGYRFVPSDEEIISYFLKHKMDGNDFLVNKDVHEVDLCKHEPWDLPGLCANEESDDQIWYFFCKRDRNKSYPCRTTKVGYWKSTGQDRTIKTKVGKKVIGTKKSLVFHIGRTSHGKGTEWTIHEYKPSSVLPHQTSFVLCKLMKKNSGKVDASACHEDEPLGNQPFNNRNDRSEIVIAEIYQEQSVSPNLEDYFHPLEMQPLGQTHEEISSFFSENIDDSDSLFNNGYRTESDVFRSSSAFKENEWNLADSFLDLTDDYDLSPVLNNIVGTQSGKFFQAEFLQPEGASNVQDVHAIVRPKECQRRQPVALSGTMPMKPVENGRTNIFVGRAEMDEEYSLAGVTSDTAPKSTSPGEEIYVIGQESSESSSSSSTTPEQEIYSLGYEWPESSDYSTENRSARRSQFQRGLSKKSAPKIQKPSAIHLSQKKSSDDSGKMQRLLVESEKDQKMVVAAASSKLRTFMSSLICFETLPTSHKQNPPLVYIANVLVGLVLFVVIGREMLIFH